MAATTSALLKAYIEQLGLGFSVYPDEIPRQAKRPLAVVQEEIDLTFDAAEDGKAKTGKETVQLDLHQDWRDTDARQTGRAGRLVVDYTLGPRLRRLLDGCRLQAPGNAAGADGRIDGGIVYVVRVSGGIRRVFPDDNVHTNTYTLEVHREV